MSEVLYLSIVDKIKEQILSGQYRPGDMLDSEATMMKEFQVSRMTIRKSLSLLSNEGYIYSIPGKGSFVCTPETDLYQFCFNKYEDLTVPIDDVKLLSVQMLRDNELFAAKLGAKSTDVILEACRLLSSAGIALAVEYIYFVYVPNQPVVEERLKFANHMENIERSLAFSLEKNVRISGYPASAVVAEHLRCSEGDTIFYLEEVVINSETKDVFNYTRFYVHPKYFVIHAATPKDESGVKKIF